MSTRQSGPAMGNRPAGSHARPEAATVSEADRRRALFGSAVGSTIEWYDYFLYGTMSSIVFGSCSFRRAIRSPANCWRWPRSRWRS